MSNNNRKKRNRILKAAGNIFGKFSLTKATMEDIASESGLAKSSIYYYFDSKEDIYRKVVEFESEILLEKLINSLNKCRDPKDKIEEFLKLRTIELHKLTNFYTALKSESLSHFEFIRAIRKDFEEKESDLIKTILQEGIDSGVFVIEDIEMACKAFFLVLKGLEFELLENEVDSSSEIIIKSTLNILFNGITV